eukprot:gnl/MRDRNA2_/MRDRNA2_311422_c0_seq1.p1 gnl/MRDRNA2_/MRDRNA2_311422_c0~~gnl/MRDRNA2_/MRDRNA2_311422_c0_seq1.p1  ORF type:complete len:145 (+),score=11.44 gnl/MRDRNA2_/MRDRNA2_311422_c0_seq1:116-550(+)
MIRMLGQVLIQEDFTILAFVFQNHELVDELCHVHLYSISSRQGVLRYIEITAKHALLQIEAQPCMLAVSVYSAVNISWTHALHLKTSSDKSKICHHLVHLDFKHHLIPLFLDSHLETAVHYHYWIATFAANLTRRPACSGSNNT